MRRFDFLGGGTMSAETMILEILESLKNPAVLLEILGYTGTALIVISMMMSSVTKLRIVNMSGSVITTIYSAICGTWPIVFLNVSLFLINGFHLVRDHIARKKEKAE